MELGKRIVFGVRVEGKVQWISIGLHCEVRSPPTPLKKGGAKVGLLRGEKRGEENIAFHCSLFKKVKEC